MAADVHTDYSGYFRNHYASTFDSGELDQTRRWLQPQYDRISQVCPLGQQDRVLEVGSALGGFYQFLPKTVQDNYVGIELDAEAVDFANQHFSTDAFRKESVTDLTEPDAFDVVYAFEVLEHLPDPLLALQKIYDSLKPGGRFCASSPYPYKKNLDDQTHLFVLHPDNWARLANNVGFSSVHTEPMSFIPYAWRISSKFHVRVPKYLPFRGFISTSLIVATKS